MTGPKTNAMRASPSTPVPTMEITPEEVRQRLSNSLSNIIGPKRPYSYADAAQMTRINERTLRAYAEGRACPNLAKYCRLLRVFGADVGRDLALMLGWTPRAQMPHSPNTSTLTELRNEISTALAAVEKCLPLEERPTDRS